MAGSFRIAEGYVEVTADESGYDRAMDRLKSRRNQVDVRLGLVDAEARASLDRFLRERSLKVKVNLDSSALSGLRDLTVNISPKISEAAERIVRNKLDRLTAERVVRIRADVDTRVGANEIANLTRRRTVRIGMDVDTRVAADDIANLTRRRSMTIQANADVTAAAARLALLSRDRHVNIRADVDRGGISSVSSLFGGALSGAFALIRTSLTSIVSLAIQALPTLASLGQSIVAMGPAAAVAVPAVLSLGAAFAAIKIGTSGIGDAFKQAFAPAVSSGGAAASATRRVEDAQRSLAKAQQGVKDAEVRAAEARVQAARQIEDAQRSLKSTVQDVADANRRAVQQVTQAERDLTDAQRDAKQAQLDLNDAREEAAQDLQDLNNRLADAQLDQRQKVLDLQDAEQNLAAVKAKGAAASKEEVDKAQLQYDRAVQGLSEQQTETTRLQQQTAEANAAGVDGSKTVTDAKKQVADANRDVSDKTRALKDAEIEQSRTAVDGAQRVAEAERSVADAREAARKAAVDGARQIADAQASVADAARSMTDAQTKGAAATSRTADALAKLSPNARSFVQAVVAQAGAWRGLKLSVQDALFAGLGRKFTTMSTSILPSLRQGLTGTAGVLNTMAKGAADAVTNLGKTGMIKKLFAGLNGGLKPLAKIPGQFLTGITQVGIAAAPAFKRVTSAAGTFATRLSEQLTQSFKNGHLEKVIDQALDIAVQFGKLIGDIFGTLGNVMKAAGAAGGDALGGLGAVFKELRKITAMPEVQKALTEIFKAVNAIAKLVATTFGAVIQAVLPLLAKIAPVITELATKFGPVLIRLATVLGEALSPIIDALLPIVGDLGKLLVDVVKAVMPLLKPIGNLLAEIITALAPFLKLFGDNLTVIVGALVKFLVPVINGLIPVISIFGELFSQLAPMFAKIYPALLPLIAPLTQLSLALLDLTMQILIPMLPVIIKLADLFTKVLLVSIALLMPTITDLIGWLTALTNKSKVVVKMIADYFRQMWTDTKKTFNDLKNGITSTWNSLWSTVRTKWNTFWSGLKNSVTGSWKTLKDGFNGLKTSVTNTWNSLWNGARDKLTGIFSTINTKITNFKNGMKAAFSTLRDSLGTIWNGIKTKIGAPVKFVIASVYNQGIRKMWNSIAGKISSKITLPAIPIGFNTGGIVPGQRSNRDTVPAMLAPGERVLSNAQVDQLGGHRGIDAMLGRDRPTGTGGNPTSAQERKRQQPMQGFADGGIIGKVTNAVGSAVSGATSWAKDVFVGGMKSAAQKALGALVRPLIGKIPSSGIGNLMRGLSNKAVDGMLGWFGNEDKKAKGGPAVQKALSWMKTQAGLPYQWAGNGNPSWDCSGLMSAIESVIRGERPHRRWATGAFGSSAPSGWVRNLNSPFMIGITNAGVGHTAGTLAGVNVESSGGAGVHMGSSARGYKDGLFTSRWGFAPAAKYDSGGLLAKGATMAVNNTGRPERILDPRQTDLFEQLVTGGGAGGGVSIEQLVVNVSGTFDVTNPREARKFAVAMADPIKEAIRQLENARRR